MDSWTINGQQQMTQQWFWYSIGPVGGPMSAPSSLDTLVLVGDTQPQPNLLDLTYQGAGGAFTINVDYTLTGSALGVYHSDMGASISIQNNTGAPFQMSFYKYSDFNLQNGAGGPNTVSISGNILGYNSAVQYNQFMTAISDVVAAPSANEAEAHYLYTTLNKLNNGIAPVTLDDTTLAGPGAVTSGFQWDFTVPGGGTSLISTDDYVESSFVPEPSLLTLFPAGAIALFGGKLLSRRS